MKLMMILFALLTCSIGKNAAMMVEENVPGGAYLVIDGKFGGDITYTEISQNTTLGIEGCAVGAKIYKFTLVVNRSGKTLEFAGKSNKLTPTMLAELRRLEKGDTFTFENVMAKLGADDDISVFTRTFTMLL